MKLTFNTKANPAQILAILIKGTSKSSIAKKLGVPKKNLEAEQDLHCSLPNGQLCCLFWVSKDSLPGFLKRKIIKQQKSLNGTAQNPALGLWLSPGASRFLAEAIQAIQLSRYDIGFFKEDKKKAAKAKLNILNELNAAEKKIAKRTVLICQSQIMAMDMVNLPNNKLRPLDLANYAKRSARSNGFKIKVLNKAQMIKEGLDAVLAVNRGSEWPPFFIVAEYKGKAAKGKKMPTIGLVGKGITFDTGGISMKGSTNMHYMKSDMGGAAAVLGTIDAVAKLKLPIHLVAIVPTTDNCVDANAIKPGDVINSHSGKSIEVIDTDAEGRLVLADGLSYMYKNFNPEVMIDLATLTGSVVRTLGYEAAGLFTNNDSLSKKLIAAGNTTGERCWRLPLWDVYGPEMDSDIADIKNFHGKATAGAITAAKFLEFFSNDHPAWAHLDIAGVAFGSNALSEDKSATGYGVNLLVSYLEKNFA